MDKKEQKYYWNVLKADITSKEASSLLLTLQPSLKKSVTLRLDAAALDRLIGQLRSAEQRVQGIAGNLQ